MTKENTGAAIRGGIEPKPDDAPELRGALLRMILTKDARLGLRDEWGQRYTLDFSFEWRGKHAILRSGWILEHDSDTPRLTTCYPL